jgi:predicted Rossmann fold nucleotide-binding protein DprA/Smf involved in DNA uptake
LADGRRAQHTRRRAAVATVMTIISGGQTGVDRAALDVALERGLPCGGPLPSRYPLRETPTADYAQRTRWNVRDADATLVLHFGRVDRGTALTCRLARQLGKPLLSVDLGRGQPAAVAAWLGAHAVRVLNVAGPRESRCPGVHSAARAFLSRLLAQA